MLPSESERAVEMMVELRKRRKTAHAPLLDQSASDGEEPMTLLVIRSQLPADGGGVSDDAIAGLVNAVRRHLSPTPLSVIEKRVDSTAALRTVATAAGELLGDPARGRCIGACYCLYGSHWTEDVCDAMPGYVHWAALLDCMEAFERVGVGGVWPCPSSSL